MKIIKIDKAMFMDQFNKTKSKGKEPVKKMAIKRDELELSEKAKVLQKERDPNFLFSDNEATNENVKEFVKRAEILPLKKKDEFASRYAIGTE
jgi:hypothetical protein